MKRILSIFLALVMVIGMLPMSILSASAATIVTYEKVTSTPASWDGEYLIVYEDGSGNAYVFNGQDAANGYVATTYADNTIAYSSDLETVEVTFATVSDGVSLYAGVQSKYMYSSSTSKNKLEFKTSADAHTLTVNADGTVTVNSSNGVPLQFNKNAADMRFRYYTKKNQQAICLYKRVEVSTDCDHVGTETTTTTVDATCTTAGSTTVVCSCGYVISTTEIPALGHSYGDFVVNTAATCVTAGSQSKTCATCGDEVTEVIAATGHSYGEDGICATCGTNKANAVSYKEVTVETITAGNYIIAGQRNAASYPSVYPATATCSEDWTVINDAVAVTDGVITSDLFAGAQVFVLTGDNTNGFTIGYNNGTEMVYLGVSDYTESRKLAFSADYNNVLWTLGTVDKGGYSLNHAFTAADGSAAIYAISDNSTGTASIRGYASGNTYYGIYLFKEVTGGEPETPVDPFACQHTNTTTTTVDATCGKAGSTTVSCNDCDYEVVTEIPATGEHNYADGTCSVCGAAEPVVPTGGYELATYISVGDTVVLVTENADATFKKEFSGFLSKPTYGDGADYTDVPAGVYVLTVCEGLSAGTFAFKTADNTYLNYSGTSNTLNAVTSLSANTSWTVAIDSNTGYANISNAAIAARQIWWNVNSPRFACYTGKTLDTTGYYGTKIYKYVQAGGCEHVWGEWVTTAAPSCTATGIQTATCSLCGDTKTQPVAATGHTYTYTETAITCANCDYSAAYTLSTIADAKAASGDGNTYYIKGIVTYVNGKDIYMEDATGGILVYGAAAFEGINIGDELLAWDDITTYQGKIETNGTTADQYMVVSSGNALPATTVTVDQITADTFGKRVVIENVTMGVMGTNNTALTDANGNSINIYKLAALPENINENDTVTVTAIVSAYNSTMQLVVNPGTAATDVVEVKDGTVEEIVTVTIAEAKAGTAGEYYQVEGVVTYVNGRNVYIQDATGGIVVYLTANAATTKVGDKVKAYGAWKVYKGLIELDAVDETNAQFYSILSSGNTVDAQEVTIAGLMADSTNEYLAEKITMTGVYVSYYSYSNAKVTYTLTDGEQRVIEIYNVPVASEEACIAGGSIVNLEAVVSAYNDYQLLTTNDKIQVTGTCPHETTELVDNRPATCTSEGFTGNVLCTVCNTYVVRGETIPIDPNAHEFEEDGSCAYGCTVTAAASVYGADGFVAGYASFADAYAAANEGDTIKLLAIVETEISTGKNVVIDLNGQTATISGTATITVMDSATATYVDGVVFGQLLTKTATVQAAENYLMVYDEEEEGYSFHAYKVEITHISLKPAADALGYKAKIYGNRFVQERVSGFGFTMGVEGGFTKTFIKESAPVNGEFTLRLQNILACGGGEMNINATAFVNFGDAAPVWSNTETTTMKDTIQTVDANWSNYSTEQQTAVTALMAPYADLIAKWNLSNIKAPE